MAPKSPLRQAIEGLEYQRSVAFRRPKQEQLSVNKIIELATEMDGAVSAFLDAMDAFLSSAGQGAMPGQEVIALYTCAGRPTPPYQEKEANHEV